MNHRAYAQNMKGIREDLFWSKVQKNEGGCWEWKAAIDTHGYGNFGVVGTTKLAHRVAYFLVNGNLPDVLDHLCRNTACVNPDHLEPVTNRENILRGFSPSTINARKTRCKKGHKLEAPHICPWHAARGRRICLSCRNQLRRDLSLTKATPRAKQIRETLQAHASHKRTPSKGGLIELILLKTSFTKMAQEFGMSDNALRQWTHKYGLPTTLQACKSFRAAFHAVIQDEVQTVLKKRKKE